PRQPKGDSSRIHERDRVEDGRWCSRDGKRHIYPVPRQQLRDNTNRPSTTPEELASALSLPEGCTAAFVRYLELRAWEADNDRGRMQRLAGDGLLGYSRHRSTIIFTDFIAEEDGGVLPTAKD